MEYVKIHTRLKTPTENKWSFFCINLLYSHVSGLRNVCMSVPRHSFWWNHVFPFQHFWWNLTIHRQSNDITAVDQSGPVWGKKIQSRLFLRVSNTLLKGLDLLVKRNPEYFNNGINHTRESWRFERLIRRVIINFMLSKTKHTLMFNYLTPNVFHLHRSSLCSRPHGHHLMQIHCNPLIRSFQPFIES